MKTSWIFVELSQFLYKCSISNIQLFLYGQEIHRLYYLFISEFSLLYFFFPLLFLWLAVIFPRMKYFSISVYSGDFFLRSERLTFNYTRFRISCLSFLFLLLTFYKIVFFLAEEVWKNEYKRIYLEDDTSH